MYVFNEKGNIERTKLTPLEVKVYIPPWYTMLGYCIGSQLLNTPSLCVNLTLELLI